MSESKKMNEVQQFAGHLLAHRATRLSRWKELAEWLAPHRGIFDGEDLESVAERRNKNAFTSAATYALQRGASGVTSGMTPRNISWFEPDFSEQQMIEASGARAYLDEIDLRMKTTLEIGGFYQAIHAFNTDLLWAGCALIYSEPSDACIMRFDCVQVGTFAVELDSDKRLDAVYRTMTWTPARMAQVFGKEALSKSSQDNLQENPYMPVRVHHIVRRRNFRNPAKIDKQNMPWESFFWEDGGQDFLHEGGYYEMPYFFTCWHEGSTPYGTGPGDDALPDARQFDRLELHKIRGIAALTNPPTMAPKHLKDVNLQPGAINYLDEQSQIRSIIDLSPFSHSLQMLQLELQSVAQRLEQQLMASIFQSIPMDQRPHDMSATEFLGRKREQLQQLGPVISAYEPNVLTPLLHRVCAHLDREGMLPIPPESLQGFPVALKMDFISPMANALRQTGAESTRALLDSVVAMAQVSPEVIDKVDLDQAVDELAYGYGAPGRVVRADADVEQMRMARAQQQQQLQDVAMQNEGMTSDAQAAQGYTSAAKNIADILSQAQQSGSEQSQ